MKHCLVVRELLQKTDLSARRSDCGFVVLSHFFVDKTGNKFSRGRKARQIQMQVIDIEEHWTSAIQRYGAGRVARICAV